MSEAVDIRAARERVREAQDEAGWSRECIESERRFGHRAARLYPLLNVDNGVRTPRGIGTLHQVIGGEARVLLMRTQPTGRDLDNKPYRPMTTFAIEEVTPYRKER